MEQAAPIPQPKDDDDEDVNWALSTATALWGRGERAEALKWLRRAAEQASDANADSRALELFKAAADVANLVSATPSSAAPPTASSSAARPKSATSQTPEAQRPPPPPPHRAAPQATPRPPVRANEAPSRRDSAEPASSMAMTTPAITKATPNVGATSRPEVRASSPAPLRSSSPSARGSDARASSSSGASNARARTSAVAVAPAQSARVAPPPPISSPGEDDLKTRVRSANEFAGALESQPDREVVASPLAESLPGARARDSSPDEATRLHQVDLLRAGLSLRGPSEAIPPAAPQPPGSVPQTTASPQLNGPAPSRGRFDDLDEDTRVLDEPPADVPPPSPSTNGGTTPIANAALLAAVAEEISRDALTQNVQAKPEPVPLPEPKRKSEPRRAKTEPRPKLPSLPAVMVAVVSNGKPGEARIMVLEPGTMPPEGAAMAILAPMSELDGDALAVLFGMQ